jgi:hypothetical protein
MDDRSDALLIVGLNPAPSKIVLAEPKGRWTRQLDAADVRFGGRGPRMPPELDLTASAMALTLPPYAAVVYVKISENDVKG